MRRDGGHGRGGRRAAARRLIAALLAIAPLVAAPPPASPQDDAPIRLEAGRFTVAAYPRDRRLAQSLLARAVATDTYPGLPRPIEPVLIAIAPDAERFRAWSGGAVPEWGAAYAIPALGRVVLQGSAAGREAGDPLTVLRHELAHLALHETLGELPPRWFEEGYASVAAGEWGREQVLATSVALALRGPPTLARLDSAFVGGAGEAQWAYALAHRAVAELALLDRERGLARLFEEWPDAGSFDLALRRAHGMTAVGFEERWRRRTRLRYGALAVVADLALIGIVLVPLMLPLWVTRRRRDRRRLERMRAAEEAAERAARALALEELLRSVPPPPPPRAEPPT